MAPGPIGGPWRVPFCPGCGQAGRHALTCEFWPQGEIVDAGNFEPVVLASALDFEKATLRNALGERDQARAEAERLRGTPPWTQIRELQAEVGRLGTMNRNLAEAAVEDEREIERLRKQIASTSLTYQCPTCGAEVDTREARAL